MIVTVREGQSIWDIALQHYGNASGVFSLLEDNGLTLDSTLTAGQTLTIRGGVTDTAAGYFRARGRVVNNTNFDNIVGLPLSVRLVELRNALYGNDGFARVEVSGGTLPYSFNWSNGQTGQNLVAVGPGDYSLTVTDANGAFRVLSISIVSADPNGYLIDENGNYITDEYGNRIIISYGR